MRDRLLAHSTGTDVTPFRCSSLLMLSEILLYVVFTDISAAPAGDGEQQQRRFHLAADYDGRGALADVGYHLGRQGQAPRSERRTVR